MIALSRSIVVVVLAGFLGILGVTPATAATSRTGADVSVGLDAVGVRLLSGARYTISVTNTSQQAVSSATVVVQLDPRGPWVVDQQPPCPLNSTTDTLTCTFGPLAPGATSSRTTWVVFDLPRAPTDVHATATLVASTPADTNAANNSDSVTCHHVQDDMGFPPPLWYLVC
nr:hypothetical protein [uncultured bacterium]